MHRRWKETLGEGVVREVVYESCANRQKSMHHEGVSDDQRREEVTP